MTSNNDLPLVTVILSSYNYEQYIEACIRSVFNQRYPYMELIIVDDGSIDQSKAVIERVVRDAPFHSKVIFQERKGQGGAFNTAYAKANGEIICFIDSDDVWEPGKVGDMVDFIHAFPDGGVYQHQLDAGDGVYPREWLVSGNMMKRWCEVGTVNTAIRHDLIHIFVPTSGLVFRKSVLDNVFPIPDGIMACPDFFLAFVASAYGPLYSLPKVLGLWRQHPENASKRKEFSWQRFFTGVMLPAFNARMAEMDLPLRMTYRPEAVLWEPVRLVYEAWKRRSTSRRRLL